MPRLSHVIYATDSGPILPELQRHVEVVIRRHGVSLRRAGKSRQTQVVAGSWELAPDSAAVDALFASLEAVDCAKIRRVEPPDPPDGGYTTSITLVFANRKTCALVFNPGVTYTGGQAVTVPLAAFLRGLSLPDGEFFG